MSAPAQTTTPSIADRLLSRFNESTGEASTPEGDAETNAAEAGESESEQHVAPPVSQETEGEAEPALEAEGAEPEAEAQAGEEAGEVEINDDADLAEVLGATTDDLHQHLKITVGEEKIPLSELISRATSAPAAQQVHEATAQERAQLQNLGKSMGARYAELEASMLGLTNLLLDRVTGEEYSDAALAQLKAENEHEWMLRSEEKRQLHATIDQVIGKAQQHRKALEAVQTPAQQAYDMEVAHELSRSIEGWSDPHRAMWDATIIGRFLQQHYSIPPELIESPALRHPGICKAFYDAHRLHRVLEDAGKTKVTLKAKRENARKSVIPTRARRPAENERATKFAAARKLQRQTAGSATRAAAHQKASREALAHFLPD